MPKTLKKEKTKKKSPTGLFLSSISKSKESKKKTKKKYTALPSLAKNTRYTIRPRDFKSTLQLKQTITYHTKTCVLSEGILKIYSRQKDIENGKVRHIIDLGTSVVSHQEKVFFSINAEDRIYRFRVKDIKSFKEWMKNLTSHRLFRQDQIFYELNQSQKESAKVTLSPIAAQSPVIKGTQEVDSDEGIRQLTTQYVNATKKLKELNAIKERANKEESSNAAEVELRTEHYRIAEEVQKLTGQMLLTLREERKLSSNRSIEKSSPTKDEPTETATTEVSATASSVTSTSNESEEESEEASVQSEKFEAKNTNKKTCETVKTATKIEATSKAKATTKFRASLPVPMVPCNVSIWSYLRIGKDMTKLSFPVEMFEPLGTLQVMCEELEYSDLLDQASKNQDAYMRMVTIACFAISRYAASVHRGQRKPFNPLEGETYENKREDLGWNYVAEQVSHHPPISCGHARSRSWEFWQSSFYTVAFWGKWIEAEQKTPVNLVLHSHKERYIWNKVVTSVHNLYSGPKYCDHHGKMTIRCSNGISSKITFKKSSGSSKHEVEGTVNDSSNKVKYKFFGKWSEAIYLGEDKKNCVWAAKNVSHYFPKFYGFNDFAITLNELTSQLKKDLPPTDSRFRPDQRLLEDGKVKEAQAKKTKLEENQRIRRKKREYQPKWFKKEKEHEYKFTDEYWEERRKDFANTEFDELWD